MGGIGSKKNKHEANSAGQEYRPMLNMGVAFVRGSERPEQRVEEELKKPKFKVKHQPGKKQVRFEKKVKVRHFYNDKGGPEED